jgi:hypothetical protein
MHTKQNPLARNVSIKYAHFAVGGSMQSVRCYSGDKLLHNGKNIGNFNQEEVCWEICTLWAKHVSPRRNVEPTNSGVRC